MKHEFESDLAPELVKEALHLYALGLGWSEHLAEGDQGEMIPNPETPVQYAHKMIKKHVLGVIMKHQAAQYVKAAKSEAVNQVMKRFDPPKPPEPEDDEPTPSVKEMMRNG